MKILFLISICFAVLSCNSQEHSTSSINEEVEKWKAELLLNGEVGEQCGGSFEEWMKNNPGCYYGMVEEEEFQSRIYDVNSDGVDDGLFFFPAINCVGGTGSGSNFAVLVYSNGGKFLTNKKITSILEDKIEYQLSNDGIYNILSTNIYFDDLDKTIKGEFYTMRDNDANCCPSINGNFQYDPFSFDLILKYETKQDIKQ